MIAQPTIAQLLRSISHDLRHLIEPAVNGKAAAVTVQMMAAVLDALAVRAENEHRWIAEEASAIQLLAQRVLESQSDAEALRCALAALHSISFAEQPLAHYEAASELLSCTLEAALRSRSPSLQAAVEELLAQRLRHEMQIIGEDFRPLGRS